MEIINILDILIRYLIPLVAFVISMYSFYESRKVANIHSRLNEMEEKIKTYVLEEKEKERIAANRSLVEARIYNVAKGQYKLKLWNSSQVTTYDVDFHVPEEIEGLIYRRKVPFEILESGKSFEENIIYHPGLPPKFKVKTTWKDKEGNLHYKEQLVTI